MKKILTLLKMRRMTPAHLRQATGISRATMSRILHGRQPANSTLALIAEVLEVSPGYLRGGYQLPAWLTEGDIMFLADRRNVPPLQLVREAAGRGVTAEEMRKLFKILTDIK